MNQKLFSLSLLLLLLLQGCTQSYMTTPNAIVIKTKKIKYADAGFVHSNNERLKLEILIAGQAALKVEVGQKICFNSKCLGKKEFNTLFLNPLYPKDILYHIFTAQAIFDEKNRVDTPFGFTQKLYKEDIYDISYSVKDKNIRFKYKIAKILIKSRQL